jgi:hypothetical protein
MGPRGQSGRENEKRNSRLPLRIRLTISRNVQVGWDNVVGIVTCYRLHGPEVKSRWGKYFLQPSGRPLLPRICLCSWYRVSFQGVKRPGRGVNYPPPSSAEVKEAVKL